MSTTEETKPSQTDPRVKRIAIFAAIVLVAFLVGLVPMGLKAWNRGKERDAAQREFRLCKLQSGLASATISARRGDYEPARKATSDFFSALHFQLEPASGQSDLTSPQRDALRPLMNDRDNLITLLARSDPASADRLSDLYLSYQKTMGAQ
jgi:hypothetical protein